MTAGDVLREVREERVRQDEKWGEQNHPNGTGYRLRFVLDDYDYLRRHGIAAEDLEAWARDRCQRLAIVNACTYEAILTEEWAEVIATEDPDELRAELIQLAAVAVAWVEKIDRDAAAQEARS